MNSIPFHCVLHLLCDALSPIWDMVTKKSNLLKLKIIYSLRYEQYSQLTGKPKFVKKTKWKNILSWQNCLYYVKQWQNSCVSPYLYKSYINLQSCINCHFIPIFRATVSTFQICAIWPSHETLPLTRLQTPNPASQMLRILGHPL